MIDIQRTQSLSMLYRPKSKSDPASVGLERNRMIPFIRKRRALRILIVLGKTVNCHCRYKLERMSGIIGRSESVRTPDGGVDTWV